MASLYVWLHAADFRKPDGETICNVSTPAATYTIFWTFEWLADADCYEYSECNDTIERWIQQVSLK